MVPLVEFGGKGVNGVIHAQFVVRVLYLKPVTNGPTPRTALYGFPNKRQRTVATAVIHAMITESFQTLSAQPHGDFQGTPIRG